MSLCWKSKRQVFSRGGSYVIAFICDVLLSDLSIFPIILLRREKAGCFTLCSHLCVGVFVL